MCVLDELNKWETLNKVVDATDNFIVSKGLNNKAITFVALGFAFIFELLFSFYYGNFLTKFFGTGSVVIFGFTMWFFPQILESLTASDLSNLNALYRLCIVSVVIARIFDFVLFTQTFLEYVLNALADFSFLFVMANIRNIFLVDIMKKIG